MVGRILYAIGIALSMTSVALASRVGPSRARGPSESIGSIAERAAWSVACLPYSGEQRALPHTSLRAFSC